MVKGIEQMSEVYSEWNSNLLDYDQVRKYQVKYQNNYERYKYELEKYSQRFVEEYVKKRDGGETYRLLAKIMMVG